MTSGRHEHSPTTVTLILGGSAGLRSAAFRVESLDHRHPDRLVGRRSIFGPHGENEMNPRGLVTRDDHSGDARGILEILEIG
jgi:hypothetical protein